MYILSSVFQFIQLLKQKLKIPAKIPRVIIPFFLPYLLSSFVYPFRTFISFHPFSHDWLIDYDGVRLTSQNRGNHWSIVHPPGEFKWRTLMLMIMMMPAGDNFWLVYQSSLAVLPADTSAASRRNGRWNENFAYSVSSIRRFFNMPQNFATWDLAALLSIRRIWRVWTRDPCVQRQAH
jgi:hypothetical protein